jgi:uncharacterized cupredoxin-like copper-binding protein
VSFDSGVFACRGSDGPPRPLVLATLAVIALVAAMGTRSLMEAPTASADASATVEVQTQRMSDATLASPQDGSYAAGEELTLVCSTRGQGVTGFFSSNVPGNDLWYKTSDGHFVADVDIETGTLKVAAPECSRLRSPMRAARRAGRRA